MHALELLTKFYPVLLIKRGHFGAHLVESLRYLTNIAVFA